MKRFFFHMSDDKVEIRDKTGVILPHDEDLVTFCRNLVLAVALEDIDELFGVHMFTVTVTDANGNELLTVPVGEFAPENTDLSTIGAMRPNLH